MSLGEKDYGKVFLLRSDQNPLKPMEKKKTPVDSEFRPI